MKCSDINIRDPFILVEDGKYYMYGTRATDFGYNTGGFDVYVSENLVDWSKPHECFNSELNGMNRGVNWAPEVHKVGDDYFMFATFTRNDVDLRGSFVLKADNPLGPFKPHSKGPITPKDWECIDATLYINKEGKPYLVFVHEHTQIIDGTMCYAKLSDDLTELAGEAVTMYKASSPYWADPFEEDKHFVTDGPFMYRSKTGELLMLWSTFVDEKYTECLVKFNGGEIGMDFEHLPLLIKDDGGHGMVFKSVDDKLYLTYHSPNETDYERPYFVEIEDIGDNLIVK